MTLCGNVQTLLIIFTYYILITVFIRKGATRQVLHTYTSLCAAGTAAMVNIPHRDTRHMCVSTPGESRHDHDKPLAADKFMRPLFLFDDLSKQIPLYCVMNLHNFWCTYLNIRIDLFDLLGKKKNPSHLMKNGHHVYTDARSTTSAVHALLAFMVTEKKEGETEEWDMGKGWAYGRCLTERNSSRYVWNRQFTVFCECDTYPSQTFSNYYQVFVECRKTNTCSCPCSCSTQVHVLSFLFVPSPIA